MKTKLTWILAGAVVLAVAGCKKEGGSSDGSGDISGNYAAPPEKAYGVNTNESAAPMSLDSSKKEPEKKEVTPVGGAAGADKDTGVPMVDSDGKTLNTLQGLQRAADYYTRALMPASGPRAPGDNRKPLPPLTDLQQLVDAKIIRAVPPPPPGKKWVLEGGFVKVKDQ